MAVYIYATDMYIINSAVLVVLIYLIFMGWYFNQLLSSLQAQEFLRFS